MHNKKYILFDLDGTITDPKEGITNSIKHSLKAFGINVKDIYTLTPFIGPPLRDSYKKFYGFNDEEAEKAVAQYREYFGDKGMLENFLYEGIDTLLETLQNQGKKLIVATSKPAVYANIILKHFGLHSYFDFVAGSELDGRRSKKSELIQYALDNMGITDIENAVMVGDREFDIIGANEVGMDSIGVLYGYGDLQELTNAGATVIVKDVRELTKLLLQ